MYGIPSLEMPASKTWMAFGWFTRHAVIPSRRKRSSAIAESLPGAGAEDLHGHAPIERDLLRAEHRGEPPRADALLDPVLVVEHAAGEHVGEGGEVAVGALVREDEVRVLAIELHVAFFASSAFRAATARRSAPPRDARGPAPASSSSPRAGVRGAERRRATAPPTAYAGERPPLSATARARTRKGTVSGPETFPA